MAWNYMAKANGGPEKLVGMLVNSGRRKMIPWIGITALVTIAGTLGFQKVFKYFMNKSTQDDVEKIKKELIKGIREYDESLKKIKDRLIIRVEEEKDYSIINKLVKKAFENAKHTDGNEHELISQLRSGDSYIKELALVAELDGIIVGHIMFTKASVCQMSVVALAPLSVRIDYQNKGIGTMLIKEGHRIAKQLGYGYAVVLGSEKYSPKFGYIPATSFKIEAPFEVPMENFMAIKLDEKAPNINGIMKYAKEFGIE